MNRNTLVLGNARLVLPGEVLSGSLAVRDGFIASMDQGTGAGNGALDLEGDYLIPGLVDLHTDNLERQMNPRTTVLWPSALAALLAHDAQVAAAGITTVLDAVFVGEYHEGNLRRNMYIKSMEALNQAGEQELLKAEHLLHLRCEFADPHVMELLEPHLDNPRFRLASLMDHTPGQRQFNTDKKFRDFYSSQNWSDAEFEQVVADLKTAQERCAEENRGRIVELCRERGIPLATHDDATEEQVDQSLAEGVELCEFPTTQEAAAHAHRQGQKVVLGSPNVCLGGSHTGNVSALILAQRGYLDILASDYVPCSMLHAAFLLARVLDRTLPQALACVTLTPARALGLDDRGCIAEGLLADLIQVREIGGVPMVIRVWRRGAQIY